MEKRIGNFIVTEDVEAGFISVGAISGIWELKFRSDNGMYGLLKHLLGDKSCERGLDDMFASWFAVTNSVLDRQGCMEACCCAIRQSERWKPGKLKLQDDEAKILEEVEKWEEMAKEVKSEELRVKN